MKVLLVNPAYQTLTSNVGVGHQVPFGLLLVGGALIDAGSDVKLIDAEARRLTDAQVIAAARSFGADVLMVGHAGSTPAHPTCMRLLRQLKRELPHVTTVYGGVFPTYHADSIIRDEPSVDIVVRGEGEETAAHLIRVLDKFGTGVVKGVDTGGGTGVPPVTEHQLPPALAQVQGITYEQDGRIIATAPRPPIPDLNHYRPGWELIEDWDLYHCFGLGRAAIIQFSRGCPHRCTYCGQHSFWVSWRHRDPSALADEIARLHHEHNVRFITLADENPTTSKREWRRFLEEIIARKIDVHFFATIRASDIARDEDILHLYKQAGILYALLGIDSTNDEVLEKVHKKSTTQVDLRACRLLRKHGIRSIMAHIVGLGDETWRGLRRARRILSAYDGDLLNAMYATPHSWTPFAQESAQRPVVQEDQRRWDYRHQVLAEPHLAPWQLFFAVKWLEFSYHAHPKRLWRLFLNRDTLLRRQARWTTIHIGAVWVGEFFEFLFKTRHAAQPLPLREYLERKGHWRGDRTVGLSVSARPSRPRESASV